MSWPVTTIARLVDQYDGFLIDQFGVLIDGTTAYPGASEALALIAERKKPVVILSNSGKRSQYNCDRVTANGFDRSHFKTVVTSGEIAYDSITRVIGDTIDRAAQVMVLGRDGDPSPIVDLGLAHTSDPSQADLLLLVSRDLSVAREDYRALLEKIDTGSTRCMCLNPDLKMLTPRGLEFSVGSIAKDFEDMGGIVEWYGKPHPLIYEVALGLLSDVPPSRILCIGDSIDHDIRGGHTAGLPTALVLQGVHAHLSEAEVAAACEALGVKPDHVLETFSA